MNLSIHLIPEHLISIVSFVHIVTVFEKNTKPYPRRSSRDQICNTVMIKPCSSYTLSIKVTKPLFITVSVV